MIRTLLALIICFFSFYVRAQTTQTAPSNNSGSPKKMSVRKEPVFRQIEANAADYTTDQIFISKAGQIGATAQLG